MTEIEMGLSNTYGSVKIAEQEGKYFWMLEDCFDSEWEEIPKYLYDAMFKFKIEKDGSIIYESTAH